MDALKGADALAINTEWDVFRHPEFEEIAAALKHKLIFDGRNLYDPKNLRQLWLYLLLDWSSHSEAVTCSVATLNRLLNAG
jgi:hypothetical protein